MPKHLSSLFTPKPTQYGLRGDPFFWSYLEHHFSTIEFPYSEKQLIEDIYNLFNQVSGETLTTEARPYVNEFAHGGMSSGCLYGEFWVNTGIPMLVKRYREILEQSK